MEDLARTQPLPEAPSLETPAVETTHARGFVVGAASPLPDGCEVVFPLPSMARFAYVPRAVGPAAQAEVAADPFLRGNQFKLLHDSPRALAAAISIAANRRVEMGPESERLLVFLRGQGLVFLENGDTFRFAPGDVAVLPAGEPARVWCQGPDDALAVVLQPRAERAERRTLAGEIQKRRAGPQ